MRLICVKGYKKTGKTTTCTRIIEELTRRGYSVGSAKDSHFDAAPLDQPHTDSWKHALAGASTVILTGPHGTNVMFQRRVELADLLDQFTEEYIVVEGNPGFPAANVVTGKTTEDLEQRRDENTICFSGVIAGELTEHDGLAVIDATNDIGRLVDLIEEQSTVL